MRIEIVVFDGFDPLDVIAPWEVFVRAAALDTGSLLLGAAGLLHGRNATTNAAVRKQLSQYGAVVRQNRVVDDGSVVTAGGVTCGADLALWLVERELGAETAAAVRRAIAYPVPADVWQAPGVLTE
ncbi:DJ-1/PfpI family protein [Mycolicibacterium pulveris]|uniref:DJ-1/PfpI family protein n=1 Tax=Mycolicibacterium pulveris TaxID=36813 RepID=UPI003CFB624D